MTVQTVWALDALVAAYGHHLRRARGLRESTLKVTVRRTPSGTAFGSVRAWEPRGLRPDQGARGASAQRSSWAARRVGGARLSWQQRRGVSSATFETGVVGSRSSTSRCSARIDRAVSLASFTILATSSSMRRAVSSL